MASDTVFYIIIFGTLFFGMMAFFIMQIAMKAHKLRIRDTTNNASYITDYKMMEKKDKKDGSLWWVSVPWQKKLKTPAPPVEVMDIGKKGKKFVEVYKLSEDQYAYIKDKGISQDQIKSFQDASEEVAEKLKEVQADPKNQELLKEYKELKLKYKNFTRRDALLASFKPFSMVQRQVIVSQFAKAEAQRKKTFAELVIPVTALLSLTVIIVMFLVYWGDIAKPALESHRLASSIQQQNIKLLQQIDVKSGAISQSPQQQTTGGVITQGEEPPSKNE